MLFRSSRLNRTGGDLCVNQAAAPVESEATLVEDAWRVWKIREVRQGARREGHVEQRPSSNKLGAVLVDADHTRPQKRIGRCTEENEFSRGYVVSDND